MSEHTPRESAGPMRTVMQHPLLRVLTPVVLAVTSLTGQTGCAALNAVRISAVGSDLDKKLLALDDHANEVNASDIPDAEKQALLALIERKKTLLKAYDAYSKKANEIAKMREDAEKVTDPILRRVRMAIIYEHLDKLENPHNAPLKDMLNDEETDYVLRLSQELEKAKAALQDKNLKELAEMEWPKNRYSVIEAKDVQRWIEEGTKNKAYWEQVLKERQARIAHIKADKASPADISVKEEDIAGITAKIEKLKADLAYWSALIKSADAILTLRKAKDIVYDNLGRIKDAGSYAVNRVQTEIERENRSDKH